MRKACIRYCACVGRGLAGGKERKREGCRCEDAVAWLPEGRRSSSPHPVLLGFVEEWMQVWVCVFLLSRLWRQVPRSGDHSVRPQAFLSPVCHAVP